MRSTVAIIESDSRFPAEGFFPTISLQEPPKADVQAWRPRTPITRQAQADVYDQAANALSRVVVDLCSRSVESWTPVPGAQPPIYMTEWTDAVAVVRADTRWQDAMRARDVKPDDVYVDIWAPGDVTGVPNPDGHRLLRALSFLKGAETEPVRPADRGRARDDRHDRPSGHRGDRHRPTPDRDRRDRRCRARPGSPPPADGSRAPYGARSTSTVARSRGRDGASGSTTRHGRASSSTRSGMGVATRSGRSSTACR